MNNYTVYFEFLGHKWKKIVEADSNLEAENIVRNLLIIHKVKREEDETVNYLKNLFGMFDRGEK